jgi:hypothetical protein
MARSPKKSKKTATRIEKKRAKKARTTTTGKTRSAKSKRSPKARKVAKLTTNRLPSGAAAKPRITGAGANRRLLDEILGRHVPDNTPLDPPYDFPARAGLAARIQRAGVSVSSAAVMACTTVGCVHGEMNRVNPAGR